MRRVRARLRPLTVFAAATVCAVVAGSPALARAAGPQHGIAMHGGLRYPADFSHFSYSNPNAPKGGRITYGVVGGFDSVNPLIIKGVSAAGVRGHVYESLMARAFDEPFSLYGLIAETIETPDDRSWVAFKLRAEAKFSDGTPITADDVIFSWATLKEKGRPNHRYYYSKVVRIERPDERTVKFVFGRDRDREMPLILGLMPILPKHGFAAGEFEKTSLKPPLGSGPYIVDQIKPGALITYRRNPGYWGRNLAVNAGRHNFDLIRYEYFRDANAAFEAFKKGLVDVRVENDPTRWATGYDFPAVRDGRIVRERIKTGLPSGMSALVFNTRRAIFSDSRVRRALGLLLDFGWINKNLYFGLYTRTQSFYGNSELSSSGRPASSYERELLRPFPGVVAPDILEGRFVMPKSDGSGQDRGNRRKAIRLLRDAGYQVRKGVMTNARSGKPLAFEILVGSRDQERLSLNYARSLKRIGIEARVRLVDSSQMQRRRQEYDFDMMPYAWFASLSPGNEQSFYWGSAGRENKGTRNYMGASEPAIDAMIATLLAARSRPRFVDAVRALDRVLLSGHYVIPLFYLPEQWIARRSYIRHTDKPSLYGARNDTWWRKQNQ